jgi:hypothetical protein
MVESREGVVASLVADGDPMMASEPSRRAFHHPAMPSQRLGSVDAAPGDARLDRAPAQRPSAVPEIAALVGMEPGRSPLRSAHPVADRRHGIDRRFEQAAVGDVCRAEADGKRDAPGVGNEMALRPGATEIGRIGAGLLAPLVAGTQALSTQASFPSMALARPRRSSRTRSSLSQTPAACQPRSRRQQVMPDPRPIACGSISKAALPHKDDAAQHRPVRNRRSGAFRLRPLRRQ